MQSTSRPAQPPVRSVSPERKLAYYVGMALSGLGLLLFLSVFLEFGSSRAPEPRSFFQRPLLGIGLIVAGRILRRIGARGLAGAGVVLDPEQARRDVEPLSRMAGGVVGDALDEAGVDLARPSAPTVVIRCRACRKLNEEDSKFCQECGQPL